MIDLSHRPSGRTTLAAALLLLAPVLASAQAPPAQPRSGFGEDLQVVTLSHVAFLPTNSTTTYLSFCCAMDSYRRPTSGPATFLVPIDASLVPNGARIEQITVQVRDEVADADIGVFLCQSWTHLDGSVPEGDCPFEGATSGAPGDTTITIQPDVTVRYVEDVDGDGTQDAVAYVLAAQFGTDGPVYDTGLRLRGARILYRRQVSPAPPSGTFGDVPTGHPFFQFVEALAASGITAGCGSGNYCPDAPLTRGQMAVFLAKALGLHWPAPAPEP